MNGRALKKLEDSWMLHILPLPKIVELWKSCCFHFEERNKETTKKNNETKQHEHSKGTLNTQQWR